MIKKLGKYKRQNSQKKMKFKLTLAIIALTAALNLVEGQSPKNNLSLGLGVGQIARQDLVFSPFIHKDFTPLNLGLEYTRNAGLYQNLKLRFASFNPMLTNPYEYTENGEIEKASQHYLTLVDLDYALGKEIRRTEKSTTTFGAQIATDVQVLNYVYGRTGSFGYYSNFGLGGFILKEYRISEKSRISGRFCLPIINWLARSPYLVNDDEFIENISSHSTVKTFFAFVEDGEFATLNKLQTFDLEAKYTYQLNQRWDIGANYFFEFIHVQEPRKLLSYRNSLSASANFKF